MLRLLLAATSVTALPIIVNTAISCDKTDFLLRIKFNDTFSGTIFTEKGSPNCVYLNASIQPADSYDVKIPLNGCETHQNADGNLENEIIVQSGMRFDSKLDKKYLLTCIPASSIQRDSQQVTLSFGGITVDSDSSTVASIVGQPKVEYQVSVRDGDDPNSPHLKRSLAVGDKVTYTVQLGPSVRGRIGRCWASDGKSELELSNNEGCSVQKSGEVWGDFEVSRDDRGTMFLNHIKAWAFPTSNEVNIFCNLHICASCEQSTCSTRIRRTHKQLEEAPLTSISLRTSFRLRRDSTDVPISIPQPAKQNSGTQISTICTLLIAMTRLI